jgi:hypothetical protein
MSFDENALFRRAGDLRAARQVQEDPRETFASDRGLSYVGLDGNIGCIINGAGLAMATMDMIKIAGGEPANFLDIGGGASPERVAKAFRAVLGDKNIETILVNIFAGINRCDWVAEGVIKAIREVGVTVPLVVRLAGTKAEEGRRILAESGEAVIVADTLAEAAEKSVEAMARLRNQKSSLREVEKWQFCFNRRTRVIVQGLTGKIGSFHADDMKRYGTNAGWRRHARQGRPGPSGPPGVQHRQGRRSRDPRGGEHRLRAAALCRRLDHGSG